LRIPDLPNQAVRDRLEAEDVVIKSVDRHSAARTLDAVLLDPSGAADANESFPLDPPSIIHKASPDDPKHPGWPAGTEGGRGGQFRPKGASELPQRVKVSSLGGHYGRACSPACASASRPWEISSQL
jgi:hypothetical protein